MVAHWTRADSSRGLIDSVKILIIKNFAFSKGEHSIMQYVTRLFTCAQPVGWYNVALLFEFQVCCHPYWDLAFCWRTQRSIRTLPKASWGQCIAIKARKKVYRTEMKAVRSIATRGMISTSCSEATNSSSSGVIDVRRCDGKAIFSYSTPRLQEGWREQNGYWPLDAFLPISYRSRAHNASAASSRVKCLPRYRGWLWF